MSEPGHVAEAAIPTRVLIVEDDRDIATSLTDLLTLVGMSTSVAPNGATALSMRASFKPDIALVDLSLPDMDGTELIRRLAEPGDCGVIAMSDVADEVNRVLSLEVGADDYVEKPLRMRELLARVRAVHRRVQRSKSVPVAAAVNPTLFEVGSIRVDTRNRSVRTADGSALKLTSAEFAAIEALAVASGQPVSRDTLCEAALRRPWRAEDRSVDQLIFSLRRKLSGGPAEGDLIHSIRGAGYVLRAATPLYEAAD